MSVRGYVPVSERFGHPLGAAIHAILWGEWDPLGVNDIAPDDEYDNYVRQIIDRLDAGEDVATIAKHLGWLARSYMGAPQTLKHSSAIASKLVALRDQGDPA